MRETRYPGRTSFARIGMLLPAGLLLLAAACDDGGRTCLDDGTCECLAATDCAAGQHCVDGWCREVTSPDRPVKAFGEPCLDDGACRSGLCLPAGPGNGAVCSRPCSDQACPDGWECKAWPGRSDPPRTACVQRITPRLCQACSVDAQCNAIGDLCLELAGEFVCSLDCRLDECPAGTECRSIETPAGTARQCIPLSGACTCSALTVGLRRSCRRSNDHGICAGEQVCTLEGQQAQWGTCDAPQPAPEVCNGIDDDCDGLTDATDPSVDVSGLPPEPPYPTCSKGSGASQCLGRWQCVPVAGQGYGWVCGATDPENEICNGRDDNCDGQADEPFRDEAGRYVDIAHCGGCGIDCRQVLPNLRTGDDGQVLAGAARCSLIAGEPTCVPVLCSDGFYPFPEQQPEGCAPLISPACQPCSTDDDCRISSDRCIAIGQDPGGHCAQSCEPNSPYAGCSGETGVRSCCPEGYRCQLFQGQRLCLPESGTCTCNAQRSGETRTCLITGAAGELCQGEQTCLADGDGFAWSPCTQSDVVVEVCDHLDNNCDGAVDEGFRDADGRYTTDAHCGECNVNCPARWDQAIQHAIGGCVDEPAGLTCRIVACTSEDFRFTRSCHSDEDCTIGTCHPDFHLCDWPPGECPDGECGTPCDSDAQCEARHGAGFFCEDDNCMAEFQYHDSNGLEVDGCECATLVGGPPDEPDVFDDYPEPGLAYHDTDCDGIDGEAASSLFVWSGSTDSRGTRDAPYTTIGEALAAFDPDRHSAVLVAAGTYRENIRLAGGQALYGGYRPDFGQRDIALYPTLLVGTEPAAGDPPGTVAAVDLAAPTTIAGFLIQGYDVNADPGAGQPARSSYALYVRNCDQGLRIQNNRILGGRGGDGGDGSPGSSGHNGDDGQPGLDSTECPGSADCHGETNPGGGGGDNASCPGAAGRPGATARGYAVDPQDYPGHGLDGAGGYNSTYGHSDPSQADLCKYDCQVGMGTNNNGGDARAGADGQTGGGGAGCLQPAGRVSGGRWQPVAAGMGSGGTAGQGGGGGGGGGAVLNTNTNSGCTQGEPVGDLGGSGGGGGGGGCGGPSYGILGYNVQFSSWGSTNGFDYDATVDTGGLAGLGGGAAASSAVGQAGAPGPFANLLYLRPCGAGGSCPGTQVCDANNVCIPN